jgi:hypothetical protein
MHRPTLLDAEANDAEIRHRRMRDEYTGCTGDCNQGRDCPMRQPDPEEGNGISNGRAAVGTFLLALFLVGLLAGLVFGWPVRVGR